MQATLDGKHVMRMMGGDIVMIQPLSWEDLVLDASVVRLVREDFRLFLEREEWYCRFCQFYVPSRLTRSLAVWGQGSTKATADTILLLRKRRRPRVPLLPAIQREGTE